MAPASCVRWPLANARCMCIIKTDAMADPWASLPQWCCSLFRLDRQRRVKGPNHSMRERWFLKQWHFPVTPGLEGTDAIVAVWSCCNCCRSNRTYQDIKYSIRFLYIAYVAACLQRLNEVMSSLLGGKKHHKAKNKLEERKKKCWRKRKNTRCKFLKEICLEQISSLQG